MAGTRDGKGWIGWNGVSTANRRKTRHQIRTKDLPKRLSAPDRPSRFD
jgi:hypothetical protein